MKILHTSDWHLGGSLYGRKRYEEYEQFLEWLVEQIKKEDIDVLLVAGDIFDNATPSNHAQELYYHFLNSVAAIPGLQVIITAGNHDSPSLLNAPKALLRQLRIHVIGSMSENISDEVLLLSSKDESESLIVCAVPYLRDRDVRTADPGESLEDKARKLQEGIIDHYRRVCDAAESERQKSGHQIPVIAMGHLFMAGGLTAGDDGVREIYVGNLAGIGVDSIAQRFDYIALGHLHRPQEMCGTTSCHYSGSPLPMGFGETGQKKTVLVIDFPKDKERSIRKIHVPCFRELKIVKGDIHSIERDILELCRTGEPVWLEVDIESEFNAASIQTRLHEMVENTHVEILKIWNKSLADPALREIEEGENLGDLDETEVFSRCLDANEIPDAEREDLLDAFKEILVSVREEDAHAD